MTLTGAAVTPSREYRPVDEPLIRSAFGLGPLWLGAAVVALACVTISFGNVTKVSMPQVAMALIPTNGFAFANAATNLVGARQTAQGTPVNVGSRERALAQRALDTEPLATRAWSVLAIADDAQAHHVLARAEMQASLRLSRRDQLTNAWMVTDATRRNDLRATMRAIDRSIIITPSTSTVYMPALAAALANDSTLPDFVTILRSRPPWALSFWREVTVSQPALRNAGELRARLALTAPKERDLTAILLRALSSAGYFETAERLYRSAQPRGTTGRTIVTNGDFRRIPDLPVFDWDLIATGEFSASIDPAAGTMEVNALPGNSGTVARQIVALDRGDYRMTVRLAKPFATSDTTAKVKQK